MSSQSPETAEQWFVRAQVHHARGAYALAVADGQAALALCPQRAEIHSNLASSLHALGQQQNALDHAERAIELQPTLAQAHNNRGVILCAMQLTVDAIASFYCACNLAPGVAGNWQNLGHALTECREYRAAMACFRRLLHIAPDYPFAQGAMLSCLQHLSQWDDEFLALRERVGEGAGTGQPVCPPFAGLALTSDAALQLKMAQSWVRMELPQCDRWRVEARQKAHSNKIRLGYFSADFHAHATGHLIAGLIEQHQRDDFEVLLFSYGPRTADPMQARLSAAGDHFIDLADLSDQQGVQLARERGLDIAIDLKGHTQHNRLGLFALGVAPLQLHYLGYPGSLGATFMDYFIADQRVVPPDSVHHFSEKLIWLPDCYQVNDDQRVRPQSCPSRAELGLPASGFVYCCFNNNYKITPEMFALWMRVLLRVPDSVLWLLEDHAEIAPALRQSALQHGVAADRLVFAPVLAQTEHLARIAAADLFLDTLPFNAHTNASDALWMGCPVLTCSAESMASRVAASLLQSVDLCELVTTSPAEYEMLATSLPAQPEQMRKFRLHLLRQRDVAPLFQTGRFTRQLELAYRHIHDRRLAGLPPEHLLFRS
jgi:predicted O-linked N-acetylglucosamine transferase (SPINDLY family)